MRILIEGEKYPLVLLKSILGDKFFVQNGLEGTIDTVGYFHAIGAEVVYLLPKVFINTDGLILNKYDKICLAEQPIDEVIDSSTELNWIKRFLIIFYKGLIEYRQRFLESSIVAKEDILQLNSSLGKQEYSFLDMVLSFVNFHKKNKNTLLFIHKKHSANKHRKVSWTKTIRKNTPLFTDNNIPIYTKIQNKKKEIDTEEILLSLFYSVLHYFNSQYHFNIQIDKSFPILKGAAFEKLTKKASRILKKIRYKYFSDTLVQMHKLLELYFSKYSTAAFQQKKKEFIMVKYYHLIFEDMVDKLLSDDLNKGETNKGISIKKLKEQKDGKVIDHLFEYNALIDRDESVFYIGDSKYYKTNHSIGKTSIYKQFTYAKNIIQFNIDLLNENKNINHNLRYRDELTEGYNITPNFFIQGILDETFDFEKANLRLANYKRIEHSYHFKGRLFDRDTLFIHYYSINFLFVLQSYTKKNISDLLQFKKISHEQFRSNLIQYFNTESDFEFYERTFETIAALRLFVNANFKDLNGKIYRIKSAPKTLIIAKLKEEPLGGLLTGFKLKVLQ